MASNIESTMAVIHVVTVAGHVCHYVAFSESALEAHLDFIRRGVWLGLVPGHRGQVLSADIGTVIRCTAEDAVRMRLKGHGSYLCGLCVGSTRLARERLIDLRLEG